MIASYILIAFYIQKAIFKQALLNLESRGREVNKIQSATATAAANTIYRRLGVYSL
ncbi:MAG TPA: hypothetical protein VFJ51_12965 [Nitrososphaeraceae archaeon]|nr:hypothetical protein [Nitrososphaeraceae archaeon]